MSIRVVLCFLFVIGFSIYAWRNWFASLCVAIVMMAVLEHPDMPKGIGGIQGLNPWNFLMLNVLLAWRRHRQHEGEAWDMPRHIWWLLLAYAFVVCVSTARLFADHDSIEDFTWGYAISDYLVNCFKWVMPGLLLFDGCRTRRRVVLGLACILSVYFLLAVQVIKCMPLSYVAASGGELSLRANKVLSSNVGYHRVNLSMMLSGASWAALTTLALVSTRRNKALIIGLAAVIALGQALTGGRAGYVTWGLLGLILCVVRWRRLLPIIPLTLLAICIFLPGVRDRMLQGFGHQQGAVVTRNDDYEMTSGRTLAWSYVIPKIWESPVFGYGRAAMIRTGMFRKIMDDYGGGESFPHPHNAYLELLLDNGFTGFLLVIPFYLAVIWHSFRVLLDRSDPVFAAVGGTACALVLALLIAAMGSQSFYPREGSVGMWAAIGLMLRVAVERRRSRLEDAPLFGEPDEASAIDPEENYGTHEPAR